MNLNLIKTLFQLTIMLIIAIVIVVGTFIKGNKENVYAANCSKIGGTAIIDYPVGFVEHKRCVKTESLIEIQN